MKKKHEIPTVPFLLKESYSSRSKRHVAWLFPEHLKQMIAFKWRTLTSHKRAFPDFIIIGEPKCGTTSLFNYLMQSPEANPPMCKETHFFDLIVHWNIPWEFPNLDNSHLVERLKNEYRAFFHITKKTSPNTFTGEATPGLMRHGGSHEIMRKILPKKTKFIVILRNPIDKSRSGYYYVFGRKGITNSLPSFDERVSEMDINEEIKKNEDLCKIFRHLSVSIRKSLNYHKKRLDPNSGFPYILGGPCYADQIETWYKTFPERDNLLILSFEEMIKAPQEIVDKVMDYLEKPRFKLKTIKNFRPDSSYDSRKNPEMKKETREKLSILYKPFNEKLYELVGREFDWD